MKIVVFNLGCKVNQYESDAISQELREMGHFVTCDLEKADCYIINTCAVTNEAERKSRQAITRCRKYNPKAKILICGCASQKNPESFNKDGVIFMSGVGKKQDIIKHIDDLEFTQNLCDLPKIFENQNLTLPNRTRAYVKIQDGCDNFCSYCIIPYLRGRSRSRKIDDIVAEVTVLAKQTKEIVLIGISLQQYGKDIGSSLVELNNALANIDVRIRLGSFYVDAIDENLLVSLKNMRNFCPHFHLSLQSGCDSVLKAMNRHYITAEYFDKVKLIRKFFPNVAITTDIIVGYPTETDIDFDITMEFVKKVGFADIHIFPFSSREGTRASKLKLINKEIVNSRKQKLLELKQELIYNYLIENLSIKQDVLFEEKIDNYYVGYSKNYIRVYSAIDNVINQVVQITPIEIYQDGLKGVYVNE